MKNDILIHLANVSADIVRVPILRGVNADLNKGNIIAVVGRNGAGKTTLLRTIMGLIKPKEGQSCSKALTLRVCQPMAAHAWALVTRRRSA